MSDASSAAGQGRLAAVIASRGGQAAPEAPFVIEHREALIYMLCEAAELEHAIMCQYLFAAFSLKQHAHEGLSDAEVEAVGRWRKKISHVATEEMLHLALVHNVLSAVGAAPHLGRPNMPQPANHYPAGVQLALLPFGDQALRHFMFLERPEGMDLKDADGLAAIGRAEPLLEAGDIVPRLQDFATVGHLYRSIEEGLAHLSAKYGEPRLFVGPPEAQATSADFRWPELVAVTDLASARRALDQILNQGEGPRGAWQSAHFGQFVDILDEYLQLTDANPDFDPVRPVLVANVRPCAHAEVPLITDAMTARCTDLFNVGYEILLQALERYFAHTEETTAQLTTLADLTVGIMFRVMKPLGDLITTLPVGPEHPGRTAGPSFELFYESDYLMPHRAAAWALLEERLHEAADLSEQIRGDAEAAIGEALAPIGPAFVELAGSLAAHFAEWGATSRWASPQAAAVGPGMAGHDAVVGQAGALADALAQADLDRPMVQAMVGLFEQAHRLVEPEPRVDGDITIAATVVNSVLRPLAESITTPEGADHDDRVPPPPSIVIRSEGTVAERLWDLARSATQLRVGPHPPNGLVEATAALQRLALDGGPDGDPDTAAARRAELEAMQDGLAAGIEVSPDGPYLVTNVANVYDWLGLRIAAQPQMALCRCGASADKPYCDGSHASTGFRGSKDPDRVVDRRDTYVGQVTIFDNRGLCQHSGRCTDRLSTVFRVATEPFVAPSGGRMDEIIRAVRDCPSGALSYALGARESRDQVDTDREAALEVSKDGPYRITGSIPLLACQGQPEVRNQGGSSEHYALCRCGHSQNKPFCSGMHWYVDFKDPVADPEQRPSMFEWCGGLPALTRVTRLFYEKYVPEDPLLAPLFAAMAPDHPERVAAWLGEVFGGPKRYSERSPDGEDGYHRMISQHVGKELTEAQRARWAATILACVDEAGLPADPEFRSAFAAYIEWGSRIAVENSQSAAQPPEHMPMPRWDWGAAGPPGSRASALATTDDADAPVSLPGDDEVVSFEAHVKTLFRAGDRRAMRFAFDLWAYDDVSRHADAIAEQLRAGTMPCDTAWSPEKLVAFERWLTTGKRP